MTADDRAPFYVDAHGYLRMPRDVWAASMAALGITDDDDTDDQEDDQP